VAALLVKHRVDTSQGLQASAPPASAKHASFDITADEAPIFNFGTDAHRIRLR
jgi:hypothetical protein